MTPPDQFPDFFAHVPSITVHDPLAELLGTAAGGRLTYSFTDAVRLTGHACPTVAGAWLTGYAALHALYPEQLPERGGIEVAIGDTEEAGVSGVIGSVLGLLTGAAGCGGFAGLGGRYGRRQLLQFGVDGVSQIRLRRRDTGRYADCRLSLAAVPAAPQTGELLGRLLGGDPSPLVADTFRRCWLKRVERILLDDTLQPQLLHIVIGDD